MIFYKAIDYWYTTDPESSKPCGGGGIKTKNSKIVSKINLSVL